MPYPAHFLSTQQLSHQQIIALMDQAQTWISPSGALLPAAPLLKDQIVANLFFENSTRTRCSFEIAAQKLGAYVLNFDATSSSTQKGETLLDTVDNLTAMGVNLLVIRHNQAHVPANIAAHLQQRARVINAGDGSNEHPTQALLDAFTIRQHKADFAGLVVTIIGDIKHSRVAHSLYWLLHTLDVPEVRLVAPCALLPEQSLLPTNISLHNNLRMGIENADVVITLRVQHERINKQEIHLDLDDYIQCYRLTSEALSYAKADAIVMHPGPLNREIEITSPIADGPHSVILEQVKLGVAMRMAIMAQLTTH